MWGTLRTNVSESDASGGNKGESHVYVLGHLDLHSWVPVVPSEGGIPYSGVNGTTYGTEMKMSVPMIS